MDLDSSPKSNRCFILRGRRYLNGYVRHSSEGEGGLPISRNMKTDMAGLVAFSSER